MQIDRMNVEWKFLYVVYQNACFFNFRDEARHQEKYLKLSWKFLTLMTLQVMTSYKETNIAKKRR